MATSPSPPLTPDTRPGLPLEERYVKLVEAYKKIKQQNALLKQAVLQVCLHLRYEINYYF